jgi:hypothetical protein
MKIFVIHYKKLINRKEHILNVFKQHNITDYEFIEIDRDEIFKENITMFHAGYSKSQIAIALSHFYAYKQIDDLVPPYNEPCLFSKHHTYLRFISREEYMDKLNEVHQRNMINKILQRIIDINFKYYINV